MVSNLQEFELALGVEFHRPEERAPSVSRGKPPPRMKVDGDDAGRNSPAEPALGAKPDAADPRRGDASRSGHPGTLTSEVRPSAQDTRNDQVSMTNDQSNPNAQGSMYRAIRFGLHSHGADPLRLGLEH